MSVISFSLPWSVLVPDNQRHALMARQRRIILTQAYRTAKDAAYHRIRKAMQGKDKLSGTVRLDATLYFPDHRRRDVQNYSKLVSDAMSGVVFTDDCQIHESVWRHGGVDRANPRAEITVQPLGA